MTHSPTGLSSPAPSLGPRLTCHSPRPPPDPHLNHSAPNFQSPATAPPPPLLPLSPPCQATGQWKTTRAVCWALAEAPAAGLLQLLWALLQLCFAPLLLLQLTLQAPLLQQPQACSLLDSCSGQVFDSLCVSGQQQWDGEGE